MKKQSFFWVLILTTLVLGACGHSMKRVEAGDVHFQAAKALYAKGDAIQALSEAQQAEINDDKNEEVQNFLGLLFAERGDMEKANSCFIKAIKIKPDYSEARNNLCSFLAQEGKYDEALEQCQKAVENVTYQTPERAYNNMAMIYEKKGDVAQATTMHQRALIHNKKFVFSLLYLGKQSYVKKDYAKAKEYLQNADDACMASPKGAWGGSCPDAQYHLALTNLQLKQTPQAVLALQHCLDSSTTNDFRGKCEKSLGMYDKTLVTQVSNMDQKCRAEYDNNQKDSKSPISYECAKFINSK